MACNFKFHLELFNYTDRISQNHFLSEVFCMTLQYILHPLAHVMYGSQVKGFNIS